MGPKNNEDTMCTIGATTMSMDELRNSRYHPTFVDSEIKFSKKHNPDNWYDGIMIDTAIFM